jgi:hypothetical protein
MPNTLEEFAGTVGVTVGELIFAMLREGAIGGAVLAVIAFLLSRASPRRSTGGLYSPSSCLPQLGHTSALPFWRVRVRFGR